MSRCSSASLDRKLYPQRGSKSQEVDTGVPGIPSAEITEQRIITIKQVLGGVKKQAAVAVDSFLLEEEQTVWVQDRIGFGAVA